MQCKHKRILFTFFFHVRVLLLATFVSYPTRFDTKSFVQTLTMPSKQVVACIQKRTIPHTRIEVDGVRKRKHRAKRPKRKLKKLCGWNVFEREKVQGSSLSSSSWKDAHKSACQAWRCLSDDEKTAYKIQAEFEQRK